MSGNTTIGANVTGGEDTIPKRIAALETRVRELASVRSLQSASIGDGGLVVGTGPIAMGIFVDDNNAGSGVIEFRPSNAPSNPAAIRGFGYGAGMDRAGLQMVTSDTDGDGFEDASLWLSPSQGIQMAHGYPVGSHRNAMIQVQQDASMDVQHGGATISLTVGGVTPESIAGWVFRPGPYSTPNIEAPNGACWSTPTSVVEWRAQQDIGTGMGYIAIRASAFTVSSSRAVKEDVTDLPFDALEAVTAAPAQQWRYKPTQASDQQPHISPMAEDLPAAVVTADGDDLAVDLRDLVGVLWAAVGQLSAEVAELKSAR